MYTKSGKTYVDFLYMVNDPDTSGLSYSTKLDHRVSVDALYNPTTKKYNFTLPYDRSDVVCTIHTGGHSEDLGSAFIATYLGSGNWETSEDLSPNGQELKVLCGVKYKYSYIPTQPVVKDLRERVIGLSSIIMSNLFIHYELTGDIYVTATPKNGTTRDYHFSGRYMGTAENLVGAPVLDNGTYRVPIRQRAEDMQIEIWSDSHYPITIR
ncbi:phage nozzle protein, partial [Pedobacter psychrotolerans]|uniref:phage nozzle protein n=1 Tax=Pedobacter psychrotolerans TaxID=1843235 RepID=UPI00403311A4